MLCLANDKRYSRIFILQAKQDLASFEEALTSEASNARDELFDNGWMNNLGSVPSKLYGWATGTAVLKVNRSTGVSGRLEALNLGIVISLCPAGSLHPTLGEGQI